MMRKWMFIYALVCLFLLSTALAEDITVLPVEPKIQEATFNLDAAAPELVVSKDATEPMSLNDSDIIVDGIPDQTYTGKQICPSITVWHNGTCLLEKNDYTVTYTNNIATGTATATITGIGNYTGSRGIFFQIVASPKQTRTVTIALKDGISFYKVYDATRNLNWREIVDGQTVEHIYTFSQCFEFQGLEPGDKFSLKSFTGAYDTADAGTHTITFTFTPADAQPETNQYSYVLQSSQLKVPDCEIRQKDLTITPTPGQTKVYSQRDPAIFDGNVTGLMSADKPTDYGKLSREEGENVGSYRFTIGTLNFGPNYNIIVKDEVFTITPKSLANTYASIPNQKYTGKAVTPEITVMDGSQKLINDRDYTVTYTNNIGPGQATATLAGIGNYAGERIVPFQILKTSIYPVPEDTPLDKAHFPDSAFRKHLSEYYDADGDAILSSEEIGVISSLDVSNLSISSLKGIEALCDLAWLYCSNNTLTDLDVTGCPILRGVICSCNALTSLDVSQNSLLDTLYCDFNSLNTLDVSKNPELDCLNCSGNQLHSIDISENKKLIWLFCSINPLTKLDVTLNPELVMINCCQTHLTALDISHNEKLEALLASSCRLKALDLTHNTVLQRLDISENALLALDIRQCPALTAFISEEFHREEDGRVAYGLFHEDNGTWWISSGVCFDAGINLNTGNADPGGVLILPEGMTVIEDEAFMGILAQVVVLPNGCRTIGSRAFANCKNLRAIVHDNNPNYVAADAFEGCDNLRYNLMGE